MRTNKNNNKAQKYLNDVNEFVHIFLLMSVCHLKISSQTYSAMKVFDNKNAVFLAHFLISCHVANFCVMLW